MILDNEQQRALILEMFDQCSFPGRVLDLAASTRRAIADAPVGATAPAGPETGESEHGS